MVGIAEPDIRSDTIGSGGRGPGTTEKDNARMGTEALAMTFVEHLRMPILVLMKDSQMTSSRVVTLASALVLACSSLVLAQTTPPPAPPQSPPAARTQNGQPLWYSHQADEMRASKLIGTNVVNAANETIGEINEIVLGKDGKVAAVIIGVGGFLGIGEREVAVSFSSLQMRRDQRNNLVLTMDATKDSLKTAPAWRWEDTAKR